jgi:hypothetical protein
MSEDPKFNPEERAVDALITGTLHTWPQEDVSDPEISEFLSSKIELTAAEKAVLNRIQGQFSLNQTCAHSSDCFIMNTELETSYMAMNRDNSKDQLPPAAREEIEQKRADLLARLKSRKKL